MTALIKYEAACTALAECKAIDEVKEWADKAAAMQAYGRMAKDKTLEVDASEIRIRAERRLGEMLIAQKAEGGLNPADTLKRGPVVGRDDHGKTPKLADAGISKDLSSRAQKLAAVPEKVFEAELAAKRERDKQDGARVSARLVQAGERELLKQPPAEEFDPLVELESMQADNERLAAEVKAAEANDQVAEMLKWKRIADTAQRRQSELMQTVNDREKELGRQSRILQRIGKAIGETDPSKIAACVEAFVRAHTKAAA